MKIERFEVPGLAQYSYVVSADGKAAVVDAIRDIDRYTTYAVQKNLTITHVLETHIHADFAAGSMALAEATGAELALSGYDHGEHYQYAMLHRALRDGDSIAIGGVRIEALHTPGHTPEHLSFVVSDTERSAPEPVALLSGDFLFFGSLGRPDLLGEAAKQGLARELYRSVHERIASLPDSLQIYPGHGAGSFCGAGMREQSDSTLGQERAGNRFFQLAEDAFVTEILASVPPMPAYYPRMKALNAAGAPSLAALPGGSCLSVGQVAELSRRGDAVLLDVRSVEAFAASHIPGSLSMGAGSNLSLWAGWLLDPAKRIVLIGHSGDDESARRSLVRVGLDGIEGHLSGGMPAWIQAGLEVAQTPLISAEETSARSGGTRILDVRTNKEWATGHIAGAQHIALGDLPAKLESISTEGQIITVCEAGYRASVAASLLALRGFRGVRSMTGGMTAWNREKLPVCKD